MQPKKQLKYIGIFEEIDSFYWPKMPMYWTFNCFLGCIYTVYCKVYIVVLVLNWLSNLEFWLPKKKDQVARIGVRGGGEV